MEAALSNALVSAQTDSPLVVWNPRRAAIKQKIAGRFFLSKIQKELCEFEEAYLLSVISNIIHVQF